MTMPWFKFFADARHDGKLWTLSGDQHRTFTHLLCYASIQSNRGIIEAESESVIANETTRGDIELLRETITALVALRCVTCVTLDGGMLTVTFLNFDKRQNTRQQSTPCEPGSSRDRVRKHRQAKKLGNVTLEARNSVTHGYTQPLDKEREEEKEKTTQERGAVLKFDSPKEESCPEYPAGDGGMWDIFPGDHAMPEKDARSVFRMLWAGWQKKGVCFGFYQHQKRYPFDVWVAAIRKVKTQDKAINSIGYIETIADDYLANGIPKPKPAQAGSRPSSPASVPLKPLHPPGTVIPAKYYGLSPRTGSA